MRKNIPTAIRQAVVKRCGITCHYCGRKTTKNNRHLDHVIPVESGGQNTETNLVVACKKCNVEKGAKEYFDYISKRIAITELHLKTLLSLKNTHDK